MAPLRLLYCESLLVDSREPSSDCNSLMLICAPAATWGDMFIGGGGARCEMKKKKIFHKETRQRCKIGKMLEVSGGRSKRAGAKKCSFSQHRCSKFHIMRRPQRGAANGVSAAIQESRAAADKQRRVTPTTHFNRQSIYVRP